MVSDSLSETVRTCVSVDDSVAESEPDAERVGDSDCDSEALSVNEALAVAESD